MNETEEESEKSIKETVGFMPKPAKTPDKQEKSYKEHFKKVSEEKRRLKKEMGPMIEIHLALSNKDFQVEKGSLLEMAKHWYMDDMMKDSSTVLSEAVLATYIDYAAATYYEKARVNEKD